MSKGKTSVINGNHNDALRGMKYFHFIVSLIMFALAWVGFRYDFHIPEWGRPIRYDFFVVFLYALFMDGFIRTYNGYKVGQFRIRDLAFAQTLADLFSACMVFFGTAIAWWQWNNPAYFVLLLIVDGAFNAAWSYCANKVYEKNYPPLKSIIIYKSEWNLNQIERLKGKATDRTFDIVDKYQCVGNSEEDFGRLKKIIEPYDAVFVAGVESKIRNAISKYCVENRKYGFFAPRIGDVIMAGGSHLQSFSAPILKVERKSPKLEYLLVKRLFDIICSAFGLLILSPLLLVIAIIIKAEDGGPVIYRQVRLTRDGREFELIKFRSMRVDAEADGVARLSTGENDDRITKIGRFIRACRIDELPQLLNILKGDMTIVGPRPERPEIAAQYAKEIPEFDLRLQVKAGLTGYAQVYGKYNTSPYEKLEFDLMYINDMNILIDLELMFATARILCSKDSTEGIED